MSKLLNAGLVTLALLGTGYTSYQVMIRTLDPLHGIPTRMHTFSDPTRVKDYLKRDLGTEPTQQQIRDYTYRVGMENWYEKTNGDTAKFGDRFSTDTEGNMYFLPGRNYELPDLGTPGLPPNVAPLDTSYTPEIPKVPSALLR